VELRLRIILFGIKFLGFGDEKWKIFTRGKMEPMVTIHPGVFEEVDVKPPIPSTPLPPASVSTSASASTYPTIRKAFLHVKFGCGSSFSLLLNTFG
jgi:hypothetical protein